MSECHGCRWWDKIQGKPRHGYCRAALPVRHSTAHERGLWPMTDQGDWCGRHEPKAAEMPREARRRAS